MMQGRGVRVGRRPVPGAPGGRRGRRSRGRRGQHAPAIRSNHFVKGSEDLKVPSGQIGSAREWYHWIGLEKKINRYMFFYFFISLLNIWKDFKVLSRFIQKWIQPPACYITVCLESCLPIGWRTFIWWKNLPKGCSIWFGLRYVRDSSNILLTSRNPKDNCWPSRIFGDRFGGKRLRFVAIHPWSQQVGGLDAFLYGAVQNFEVF